MHIHDYYYDAKPFIPWKLRMAARRVYLKGRRRNSQAIWPVDESAARPPAGWPGWPEGKKFAFILTHDVEGQNGLEKCKALMELEREFGFVSCFNFIPEGEYEVPVELRSLLAEHGFEVGVHDLYHDGKLYRSREGFRRSAVLINKYLEAWGAVGFRSGFMHHNLEWLHDLNIAYDCSTFDTDPFEPQPDPAGTIFPFWVEASDSVDQCLSTSVNRCADAPTRRTDPPPHRSTETPDFRSAISDLRSPTVVSGPTRGYLELPYTLPQDSTLFLLFNESNIDTWKRKLDWIASHGGMALLNVHPDYMYFDNQKGSRYPASLYREFLSWVRESYSDQYWHVTPREAAAYSSSFKPLRRDRNGSSHVAGRSVAPRPKLWIDLDNTPHVPFFEPILDELKTRGYSVLLTARDAFQVCELAEKKGLPALRIGKHYGKSRLRKGAGLCYRALQLAPAVLRERPVLGISHGARSQLILSNLLGIKTLLLEDYEFARFPAFMRPTWVMAPEVIPDQALSGKNGHIRKYAGIKEDVYAWKLIPDDSILHELGLSQAEIIVIVRPPATEAHYHNPESEKLFAAFMDRACSSPGARMVLLPRNKKQGEVIRAHAPQWFDNARTVIPPRAVDGMNLIWHSDLVVSGGGTMNREAAALGVPVYSIFRGTIGAVDRHLAAKNRLVLIESIADVSSKIPLVKRPRKPLAEVTNRVTLYQIVDAIEELALRS